MKGRTTCPKCFHRFNLELPEDNKKHEITCPKCKKKFSIIAKCETKDGKEECSWEEHGEPRKTILSAIKTQTKKPMIAFLLLFIVFILGIATTAFSEVFIESTLDIGSGFGLDGTVEINVIDETNITIVNATVFINDKIMENRGEGIYYLEKVELGVQTINITKENFSTINKEILVVPFFKIKSNVVLRNGTGSNPLIEFDSLGCSIILAIFSVFALLSSIACFKREYLDVAIAGSIIGIFSFGFFFIGSILCIIAFILIFLSRDEFENGKKGRIF